MVNYYYRIINFEVQDIIKKQNYSHNCSERIHYSEMEANTYGLESHIPK